MKEICKSSWVLVLSTIIVLILSSNLIVLAGEPLKRPGLDLTLPPKTEEAGEIEENILEEKYREILDEISISPEAVAIVDQIKGQVTDLEDLSLEFEMTQVRGKRVERVRGKLFASLEHKMARVEFLEPDALRGYIVVVDQDKKEARQFRPVTNQIEIQSLDDASQEALSALSMTDITSYFDFTQYDVVLLDNSAEEGTEEYLLQLEGWQGQELVQLRVSNETWIPQEVILYEKDVFVGKVEFTNVLLNGGLSSDKLKQLPKVKEVRM